MVNVQALDRNLISIYPNPFHDVVVIDTEKGPYDMILQDQTGRVINRETVSGKVNRNFASLTNGLYYLRISERASGASAIYKIVKL